MTATDERGAIGFAEKILELIAESSYTATYKLAVLLGLLDLCMEETKKHGEPPTSLTTRQLAEKVVETYWPHTMPFGGAAISLRQNTFGQAEIVTLISRFRERHGEGSATHWESRHAAPVAFERLVRDVEWKLIEMPLPRLQLMGNVERRFIYQIEWDQHVRRSSVSAYQRGALEAFANGIRLMPGVGEYFLQLAGLLRPIVHRRWSQMVSQINGLEDTRLEEFLFGADRTATARIRRGLVDIQDERCFYCDAKIASDRDAEVDHFIPWARYPDNGIDNLVAAHPKCNGDKSSSLASADHLCRWTDRLSPKSTVTSQLQGLADTAGWLRRTDQTLSIARAIYLRLPGDARLWWRRRDFVAPDIPLIRACLETIRSGEDAPNVSPL